MAGDVWKDEGRRLHLHSLLDNVNEGGRVQSAFHAGDGRSVPHQKCFFLCKPSEAFN